MIYEITLGLSYISIREFSITHFGVGAESRPLSHANVDITKMERNNSSLVTIIAMSPCGAFFQSLEDWLVCWSLRFYELTLTLARSLKLTTDPS